MRKNRYSRAFFLEDTFAVAKRLLGSVLCSVEAGHLTAGKIVEVEAYLGGFDKAAHAYGYKRTHRTEIQYGVGGYAYITLIYGLHWQCNVVTAPANEPHAVLIRALEPVAGIEIMQQRRGNMSGVNLTNGPGKLCQALGITGALYGADLCGNQLWIEPASALSEEEIIATTRIGVDYAAEFALKPWRFYVRRSRFVSKK